VFNNRRRLFDFELDEDRVVTNVRTGAQLFQRHEPRIAEADAASRVRAGRGIPRRPLELPTAGTRHETLGNVLALLRILVVQNDRDRQSKRPVEQGVIVAGDDPDVNGQVRALARAASAGKQRRSKSISVRRRVESGAFDLSTENTRIAYDYINLHLLILEQMIFTNFQLNYYRCRSTSIGRSSPSVCLSVCPQHNSTRT